MMGFENRRLREVARVASTMLNGGSLDKG
jgi:hypothetical protein